jgi:hypothetical protein
MTQNRDERVFAIILALVVAVLSASTAPWWWNRILQR